MFHLHLHTSSVPEVRTYICLPCTRLARLLPILVLGGSSLQSLVAPPGNSLKHIPHHIKQTDSLPVIAELEVTFLGTIFISF